VATQTQEVTNQGEGISEQSLKSADSFLMHLVNGGRVTVQTADRVARVQRETVDRLAAVILKLGLLSEEALAAELAAFKRLERLDCAAIPHEAPSIININPSFLRAKEVLVLGSDEAEITIACWDALDESAERYLRYAFERPVTTRIGTRQQVKTAIDSLYPLDSVVEVSTSERDASNEDEEIDRLKDLASDAPVIRLVQQTIDQAIVNRASDIHFESSETSLKVRFRLDGMLRDFQTHPKAVGPSVISRIKIMAALNIAETRLPQDGRLSVTVQGKSIDFRVASSPGLHGESLVLRILDRQDVALDFDALGFDGSLKNQIRDAISRPYGIVLVTGPTGSGKTTTLYAAMKEINSPDKKILTVEDPVEYVLPGVNQVPIRPQIGLTFAHVLRSFLRQDPDVLMVGEIRDRETAEIAVQAALTGHLLLSTLHTNTASAAMTRLLDMGMDDFLLTSTLHLVMGQRLLRRLCMHCREPFTPSDDMLQRAGLARVTGPWHRPRGCEACQGSGFRGRTAIIEALPMSDAVRSAVLAHKDAHTVERIGIEEGMRTMFQHGVARVNAGETTLEEVLRVTSVLH
jgi:general secretion pathway protein E